MEVIMFCVDCGFEVSDEISFCPKCGKNLKIKTTSQKVNDSIENKEVKKLSGSVMFWIISIISFLIFILVVSFAKNYTFERAIFFLLAAIIAFPPLQRFTASHINFYKSFFLRLLIVIICFVGVGFMNSGANTGFYSESEIKEKIKESVENDYLKKGYVVLDFNLNETKIPEFIQDSTKTAYKGVVTIRDKYGAQTKMKFICYVGNKGDFTWKTY